MPTRPLEAAIAATRFGLGARPGEIASASNDPQGFLLAQIRPEGGDLPDDGHATTAQRLTVYADFAERKKAIKAQLIAERAAAPMQPAAAQPATAMAQDMPGQPPAKAPRANALAGRGELIDDYRSDVLARVRLAATTPAGFRERWALFWANHFTVSGRKFNALLAIAPFEREAIRPHMFGRFEDMAKAVAHHPAMLLFLEQARSAGPNSPAGQRHARGLNENLARETLELHTLGAGSGYTQDDVTELARALTGFTVARKADGDEGAFRFAAEMHEPGTRTILGRSYAQVGERQADAILHDLAHDPRTARHLARKLAAHFVADDPPPALVAKLEAAWTGSDGDLAKVARALVTAPEAWTPAPAKFKTPYEFLVSCYRARGAADDDIARSDKQLDRWGQRPYYAPSPKGWPDEAGAWATSAALMDRLAFAGHLAAASDQGDPRATAEQALGARLAPATAQAIARAESRPEGYTLLLMSPEFQRR